MPLYFDILGRKMKLRLRVGFAFRAVGGGDCARRQSYLKGEQYWRKMDRFESSRTCGSQCTGG